MRAAAERLGRVGKSLLLCSRGREADVDRGAYILPRP